MIVGTAPIAGASRIQDRNGLARNSNGSRPALLHTRANMLPARFKTLGMRKAGEISIT